MGALKRIVIDCEIYLDVYEDSLKEMDSNDFTQFIQSFMRNKLDDYDYKIKDVTIRDKE